MEEYDFVIDLKTFLLKSCSFSNQKKNKMLQEIGKPLR